MNENARLLASIDAQYENAWTMLCETIEAFRQQDWRSADFSYLTPARLAYHTIETVDFYARRNMSEFVWGHRAGIDWESTDADRLPDQIATLEYLGDTRVANSEWLQSIASIGTQTGGLLAPDVQFHEEGMCYLDRALYVLRHTHQHMGELAAELRRRGLPRPGWR
ncbi:MAG: hypothetical protein HOH43_16175 [Candidatus Latescibacteria bacterium]|jgi:hypothetical protein|nr:hypothetical protein [Candidatus Latescibacterota bacterium]